MSDKQRLPAALILPTKEELDKRAEYQRQIDSLLSRMRGYSSTWPRLLPLEAWQERYVSGAIDFETFEAGLAERVA